MSIASSSGSHTPTAIDPKWERERAAFIVLLPKLRAEYFGQFVAIHDGGVIAAGTDESLVLLEAFEKAGRVAIHVERVPPTSTTARVRSPRVLGSPSQ